MRLMLTFCTGCPPAISADYGKRQKDALMPPCHPARGGRNEVSWGNVNASIWEAPGLAM